MTAHISRALLDQILSHAASDPQREVCGLLLGVGDRIAQVVPAANVAADPSRRFEVDPAPLFAAVRAERVGGPRLLGHYHSHPSGRALPSPRDAAMADRPGRLWLIVTDGEALCWRESPGGSVQTAFEPCPLRVEDGCA